MANEYAEVPVRNPFGAPVWYRDETTSTMEDSRLCASSGAPTGTVVCVGFQTAGRGRVPGRVWEAEREDSLLFTILFRDPGLIRLPFPLAVGLAVVRGVDRLAATAFSPGLWSRPLIKWPNDVMLNGKKLCGILCESSGGVMYAGVGVNCNRLDFPPELAERATSLAREYGAAVDRFDLLAAILGELPGVLAEPDIPGRVSARLFGRGEEIEFREGDPGRNVILRGLLAGIGPGGSLLIEVDGEPREFWAGEIIHRAPAGTVSPGPLPPRPPSPPSPPARSCRRGASRSR